MRGNAEFIVSLSLLLFAAWQRVPAQGRRDTASQPSAQGKQALPNDAGQVWREYDLREYLARAASAEHPEELVVDWILRETGTDTWFRPPIGFMNVGKDKLTVFHTPEIQSVVAGIVDRLVGDAGGRGTLSIRLISVDRPDWRATAWSLLTPVPVQSPGIEAWSIEKEDAAVLMSSLRSRPDFRELNSPNSLVRNGQSQTIRRSWPRRYVSRVDPTANSWPGYILRNAQIEEGYSLRISPLYSSDATSVDAVIKCNVDQVDRMASMTTDISVGNSTQQVRSEIPEVSSWQLHERFRWSTDKVLLISRGIVFMPTGGQPITTPALKGLFGRSSRVEVLLFLESQDALGQSAAEKDSETRTGSLNYRGRY